MEKGNSGARIPLSTYRLQFNKLFRFSDAKELIPYLHCLGISDIYSSPCQKAREGSLHCYDIVDHNALNPEMGNEEDYTGMIRELWRHGMGQILDIVPNHMCIASKENAWWMDVLENGPSSIYSDFFDISWNPVKEELRNKTLLPILGDQYGMVLENQELRLSFEEGAFFLCYYDYKLPIRPQTYNLILERAFDDLKKILPEGDARMEELLSIMTAINHLPPYTETIPENVKERRREKEIIKRRLGELREKCPEVKEFIERNVLAFNGVKGEPRSFDLLDRLIREQVYRLSFWRVATDEINYRRFFDISELAAIRMEDPAVFQETHRLIFRLIREGAITGVRADHPDGLYNPEEYLLALQKACCLQTRLAGANEKEEEDIIQECNRLFSSGPRTKPFYIMGEKILTKGEKMPEDWPIFGTTGYAFLNSLNGIFIDASKAKAFDCIYSRFTGIKRDFADIVYEKKKLVMEVAMSSEVNALAHILNRISEDDRHTRDFTLNSLRAAIMEVIAFFPVYRTYITANGINDRDRRYIETAASRAKRKNPAISESIFDFLKDVLELNYPSHLEEDKRGGWLDFAMRFQQITGPVMAKGVEDTAFYVYNRFVSLNEVGGSPERFGASLEAFHGQNMERAKLWPHALVATSTHDTKRSEDTRARLNVLSEMPHEWRERVGLWSRVNKKNKALMDGLLAPDRNEEYLFYQTLVGAWPLGPMNAASHEEFTQRIKEYTLKAIREAKVNSSWINPNTAYEDAVTIFIERALAPSKGNRFLRDMEAFQDKVSWYGKFNSLSQTLLKILSPGVPDFYQGNELFDFSLVDPDNRRPVDYGLRIRMLAELKEKAKETPMKELAGELMSGMDSDSGRIKLYLTWKALNWRKENRELSENGEYIPLDAGGERKDHLCAFSRRLDGREAIVAVPRFLSRLAPPGRPPLGEEAWGDAVVFAAAGSYRNVFTGEITETRKQDGCAALLASELFKDLPFAVMENAAV